MKPDEDILLPDGKIIRHGNRERIVHWSIAIAFIFLFLSGLALFSPFFFWIAAVFGGGQFMRLLHPFAGVLLVLLFYPYAWGLRKDNRWTESDARWVENSVAYMEKRVEFPDTGKYNAGQKLMYWSMVPIIGILFLTGITMWQPWFASSFPAPLRRVTSLVHAVSAFVMFIGIGIHWYAAYWTRGSIRAMVRGTVTKSWARYHHPAWFREITGGKDR
ncbi:MAG: formate dehydrogenase subunit gamma [Deltaproteobacteria bacterium]